MSAIGLDGFAAKFAGDADPWRTFASRDEALKRAAILHALGPGPLGRVLEVASGNGSNARTIAPRARRLDATEGTAEGARLTAKALAGCTRAYASVQRLPGPAPLVRYDAVVVAEILYYLTARDMAAVARDAARWLRPGGRLVLAHHRIDYYDFAQHAHGIHRRFLRATGANWRLQPGRRTGRWQVLAAIRTG